MRLHREIDSRKICRSLESNIFGERFYGAQNSLLHCRYRGMCFDCITWRSAA
jgi:hypothetical protein